jgi:hypothetical protein
VRRLRLPWRAPRNVAHESTLTRRQLVARANVISNFPEADFWTTSVRDQVSHPLRRDSGRSSKSQWPPLSIGKH